MKCIKCNHDIDETKKFCKYCGTPVSESLNYYSNQTNQNNFAPNNSASVDNGVQNINQSNYSANQNFNNNDLNNSNLNNQNLNNQNLNNQNLNNQNLNNQNLNNQNLNNQNLNNQNLNNPNLNNPNYNNQNYNSAPFNQNFNQNNNPYNSSNAYGKGNSSIGKKKIAIIAGSCIAALLIILIAIGFVVTKMSSPTLSEKQIKESLYGKSLYINGIDVDLSEDNIKEVNVESRKTEKKKTDDVLAEVVLQNGSTTITVDTDISYYYYDKWVFSDMTPKSIKSFDTEIDLNKLIKENICEEPTVYTEGGKSINSALLADVTDAKLDFSEDDYSRTVQANVKFTNGVYTVDGSAYCDAEYDWDKDEMKISYSKVTLNDNAEKTDKVDEEALNNAIENYLANTHLATYEKKFNIGNAQFSSSTYINGDIIKDVQVGKYVLNDANNLIVAEVKGKLSKDIITEVNFEGNVSIPLNLAKDAEDTAKLNVTTGKVTTAQESDIQKLLIDAYYDGRKLTMDEASTFKETKRNSDGVMCDIVHGTMTINGQPQEVQIQLVLKCDMKGNISWSVYNVQKKGSYSYAEF